MKALTLNLEKIVRFMQKALSVPNFKPKLHNVVDFEDITEPELINENWVKIKVKFGGICGSDLNILSMNVSYTQSVFASFPAVMGHEIVGIVVETGNNVDNISINDRVVVEPLLPCEVREIEPCSSCKEGNYHLCSKQDQGVLSPGQFIGGCKDTGGGWGEYIVVHKSRIFKIPESVSFKEALMTEPLAVAIHGIFKKLPNAMDNVVVIGSGTIGLLCILALKSLTDCRIIASAKYAFQSDLAKQIGADEVYQVKKDRHIKKIGKKLGCKIFSPIMDDAYPLGGGGDIVIDSVGNSSSIMNSIRLTKEQGTMIMIGVPAKELIDWTPLVLKECEIISSHIYSFEKFNGEKHRTFQMAIDLIASSNYNFANLVTHEFYITDYKKALETASNKKEYQSIKTTFVFD
ncbi:MAG: alcohol dehydrogenase catalytic domain-containing protein [Candidatus Lokiarchaeota archaeon]|nr:alcohol dehydrogenase catalytic domain-containing protein [Candidatus Lokiarchaeota archaeon]